MIDVKWTLIQEWFLMNNDLSVKPFNRGLFFLPGSQSGAILVALLRQNFSLALAGSGFKSLTSTFHFSSLLSGLFYYLGELIFF